MESGSPPVDLSTSSEYDDDEVSPGDDEICIADDPYTAQNFVDVEQISRGAYGSVWKGVGKHDGKKSALKFVKLDTDLVYREVEVLKSLAHKNVLKYHNHWIAAVNISNTNEMKNIIKIISEEIKNLKKISEEIKNLNKKTSEEIKNLIIKYEEIKNQIKKISEKDDATLTPSYPKRNFNTNEIKNLIKKISEEIKKLNKNKSEEIINLIKKIFEEIKNLLNTNERNNANNVSTFTSRRFKSSEEEHVSLYLVIQTELCQPTLNLQVLIESKKEYKPGKFFLEMLSGVQYIHGKRIIHRDLKPANILIGIDDQEAKIADFGLSKIYSMSHDDGNSSTSKMDKDSLTSNLGTIPYVAPEVLKSIVYSYKADLYSLGIILSEMYLEMGSGRPRIMDRLRSQDFADLKNIPDEVVEVIKSLLSHEPSMRMELERVIDIMSPLEHHQRVEVSCFFYCFCKKLKHCVYTYLTFYSSKSNKNLRLKQYLLRKKDITDQT